MSGSHQIVCPKCGGVNRVPDDRPAGSARCGKCGTPLFASKPVDADADMFRRQTQRGDIPVLVDVWAPWCGPCRMMSPAFEAAAATLEPGIRLLKLNSDSENELAARLGIRSIPTMLLFAEGQEVARVSGAMTSQQIVNWARDQLRSRT
ncbi:thioredoxin TrxC [Mesorhizobium sp. J428]|uniref:thioredoxin TrxC n=1 Tax=Mesorhizobium sp. J428 TaxID=2898440 RepID=UPI0021515C8B|nr:thioredoxin TrxC [Mesorhizobium sp. J428]MCR5857312.1 thioredoxin TrxC [Mesorhizobium sp. J428]